MKKLFLPLLLLVVALALAGCQTSPPTPLATATSTQNATATRAALNTPFLPATNTPAPTVTVTPAPTATPTRDYPAEGYGPTGFPEDINPLTGLKPADPQLLNRRPILIKVQNLPRADRPQSGLSFADIVYEFYTELGSTRFAALFYSQDATQVMPIRSARFADVNVIRMYKPVFVFGSAYELVFARLVRSEFSGRLVIESGASCPAVCRFDPRGKNYLAANTSELQNLIKARGINNTRPNLDGMYFNYAEPQDGKPASQVFVRFSGAVYNRWDYDAQSGRYLRFSETRDDVSGNNPDYAPLTDALTNKQIAADNLVIIQVRHNEVDPRPEVEVLDMSILGSGQAFLFRDGVAQQVNWQRLTENDVLTLVDADGKPVAFKPGKTWFEVMSLNTTHVQEGAVWRFKFVSDW
ncbi:MAG: DUF3048 domain-containing protein [Chloroflexota bacterium]